MNDIEFLLNQLYTLYEIPMRCFFSQEDIFKPGIEVQAAEPLMLDQELYKTLTSKYEGLPVLIVENKNILYGVCGDNNGTFCILGPVALSVLSGSELYQYKYKHDLLNYNHFKILNGNIARTAAVLALLHEKLNNSQIDLSKIMKQLISPDDDKKITEKELFSYKFQNVELSKNRIPYSEERACMTAIANGDRETLEIIAKTNVDRVGLMANRPIKQIEYVAITGITLFGRAAIKGGVNPDDVYAIADLYKQKIASSQDAIEMQQILKSCQLDFCECVQRAKAHPHGLHYIELCKRYVAKHLHHQFSLEDISSAVGLNKCYLTHQFTLQEGKSLKRFIHEERIHAAQNMLKYSDQSISVIASYLCFDSQSHFGSVFKKITGLTPSAYRTEKKNQSFFQNQDE